MNQNPYIINGLKLPNTLIQLLEQNLWKAPKDKSGIQKILALPPHLNGRFREFQDFGDFETYNLKQIRSESQAAKKWPEKDWIKRSGTMFLGANDEMVKPGTIDVDKAILIADLGWGSDSPFTLDYRDSMDHPSVMIIRWGSKPATDNRWMKLADSFDAFIEMIGINAPN